MGQPLLGVCAVTNSPEGLSVISDYVDCIHVE